jgi:hypothetical protein
MGADCMTNKIATLDLETDPFEYGKMIDPFVAGFYDGEKYVSFWSEDCVQKSIAFLKEQREPLTIYIHNGGRFDLFWYLPYLGSDVRIINGRIVQAHIGIHEIRDSFAIMPFPLAKYQKTKIDYQLFRKSKRERHREQITAYLRDDCVDLHTLVTAFVAEFGDSLTIGSTAMKEIKKQHEFSTGNGEYDRVFRSHFYFGGRNQVFQSGIIRPSNPVRVYDVNSMYPHVMRDYLHPISTGYTLSRQINSNTTFVELIGRNNGALPVRMKDNSLNFTIPYGTFCCSIHEFRVGVATGTLKPNRIVRTINHKTTGTFDKWVDFFYSERLKAKLADDKIKTLFYKFILNSGYGKFAQNPDNYFDWRIEVAGSLPPDWHDCQKSCEEDCRQKWQPAFLSGGYVIWKRPLKELRYFNIATGASITGAARAVLLNGIAHAVNPIYCDTDSIICERLEGLDCDADRLGAWKVEVTGKWLAVAGKKMYAVFDAKNECVKMAHKGAKVSAADIVTVAKGGMVESCNPVPTFKFDGSYSFTKRRIRKTA